LKNLNEILGEDYRVIEFSLKKSLIINQAVSRDKLLTIVKSQNTIGDTVLSLNKEKFIKAIRQNSTDVLVLNCAGWSELKALQNKIGTIFFFERITGFNIPFLIYFLLKGILRRRLKFKGIYYLKREPGFTLYLGIKSKLAPMAMARHHLSPLVNLNDFFNQLNEENVSYCILRWFEDLPKIEVDEDIDMLVEDNDLSKVYSIIDRQPGIIPFDIYSKSGITGSDYQSLPYYVYSLAMETLNNAILYKNTFKVPTWENYFYLLAYHAVFHKGENSGLISERYKLNINNNPDHNYLNHLKRILAETDLNIKDFTLEGLHNFLDETGYAPPLDTQYKLSLQNQYLKAHLEEYHNQSTLLNKFEGLVCFIAREKIVEAGLLEELKELIQKEGFTIICTKKLEGDFKEGFTEKVRGGNWNQGPWPSNGGAPSTLVVALDVYPVEPEHSDQRKHPGLTNKRIQEKNRIRDLLNDRFPDKSDWCNGVHSSDNEIQAIEYLLLAGLDTDDIFKEIQNYREIFETKYPVIKVLSRYSRRAKIELVSYKGKNAIIKTFKPRCEWFLANEIEAYKEFGNFEEIPKLLETGDNYIITQYIEGSKPLEGKIDIKTLKICLSILRKVYDKGYSLLDFGPTNFLMDNKKKIYMIDFEFLHKYDNKPPFIQCFDLVGFPDNFNQLRVPITIVPKGEYQYDVLWGKRTGIYYNDLLKLNDYSTYLKSIFRRYKLKFQKLILLTNELGMRGIKAIHKIIP